MTWESWQQKAPHLKEWLLICCDAFILRMNVRRPWDVLEYQHRILPEEILFVLFLKTCQIVTNIFYHKYLRINDMGILATKGPTLKGMIAHVLRHFYFENEFKKPMRCFLISKYNNVRSNLFVQLQNFIIS